LKNVEFNEAFMGAGDPLVTTRIPGFGAANRTAQTSRVHKSRAKGVKQAKPVTKGLARSAVAVVRLNPRKFEIRVKGSRALLGFVTQVQGAGGKAYAYQCLLPGVDAKVHKGFATQKEAVARMLEKC